MPHHPDRRKLWLLIVALVVTLPAQARSFTEVRDPLRGVTYYSAHISTDPLSALQTRGGGFVGADRVTLGISALFFDEEMAAEEYVLWLRHDGPRRWLAGNVRQPFVLEVDGVKTTPMPLHVLRAKDGDEPGMFVEKLEFAVDSEAFHKLLGAASISIQLSTLLGTVEKTLTDGERGVFRTFYERAQSRQAGAIDAIAATPR
ncbi:MAG: hypothetical protein HC809_14205 [Gammaproteobacteria bacterium]|nr:hypothetical protein [Gammaproteobacteria bacterium]